LHRYRSTTLEWLYSKKLITDNEFISGKALALLLEWRMASFAAVDSNIAFARKISMAPPNQIIALERPLLVLSSLEEETKALDVDTLTKAAGTHNEFITERMRRNICTAIELNRLIKLFDELSPRGGLLEMLAGAVTERITVRKLPHKDVPLIALGLFTLKEHWREYLLEDAIDEATGLFDNVPNDDTARNAPRRKAGTRAVA
jgi:hypothetical protein